jgi:DNA polymerase-3 subunit beta
MKLVCEREKLLHAFQTAAAVAPARSPKPILQNVKIEAAAGRTTLTATDLEIGIRIDVLGVEAESPGSAVLPIDRFGLILRESSDEKLTVECDGRKTLVRGGRSEFNLPAENPDEFPAVNPFQEQGYHQVPARFLRELIRRTVFATDPENSRYALGGVLLELSETEVLGVATDGRRLARQVGPGQLVGGHKTTDNTIVPTRAMQVIERSIADNEGEVQLAVRENDVLVKSDRTTIYSRLLEGRYPKWRDVFPRADDAVKVQLCAGPFYSAVRQAAIVTSTDRRGVDFSFGEGKVQLSTHGAEKGEAHVQVPIDYDGRPLCVTLDPRYVSDFLRVLDGEATFTMQFRDPESAVVCATEDGYSYVIMPLARER